jgi:hypothetical protein
LKVDGSKLKVEGSRLKVDGSKLKVEGSRLMVEGYADNINFGLQGFISIGCHLLWIYYGYGTYLVGSI